MQGSLTRPDLKREMKYLEKLLYKNRNQHRESQHFRRLQEASPSFSGLMHPTTCMLERSYMRFSVAYMTDCDAAMVIGDDPEGESADSVQGSRKARKSSNPPDAVV